MRIVRFMPEVPLTRLHVCGKMFRTVEAGKVALLVGQAHVTPSSGAHLALPNRRQGGLAILKLFSPTSSSQVGILGFS